MKAIKVDNCDECSAENRFFCDQKGIESFVDCPLPDWPKVTDKEMRELVIDMITEAFPRQQLQNKLHSIGVEIEEGKE